MANGYDPINWENNITPLSAENLNKMDQAINNLYDNMQDFTKYNTETFPAMKETVDEQVTKVQSFESRLSSLESEQVTTTFDSSTGTLKIRLKTT